MGQYHKVYNIDKREFIHGRRIDNGLKLMEQCGHEKSTATAVWFLLANSNGRGSGDASDNQLIGRWSGDRLVVQGDYAEEGDQAYLTDEQLDKFSDISQAVKDMLDDEFNA